MTSVAHMRAMGQDPFLGSIDELAETIVDRVAELYLSDTEALDFFDGVLREARRLLEHGNRVAA